MGSYKETMPVDSHGNPVPVLKALTSVNHSILAAASQRYQKVVNQVFTINADCNFYYKFGDDHVMVSATDFDGHVIKGAWVTDTVGIAGVGNFIALIGEVGNGTAVYRVNLTPN